MTNKNNLISWGFIISFLSLSWAVFTWWEAGNGSDFSLQDRQQKLLADLIEETRKTRFELITLSELSRKQLEKSEYANSIANRISEQRGKPKELLPPNTNKNEVVDNVRAEIAQTLEKLIKPKDPAIGKVAWIFIGKYNNSKNLWDSSYHKTIEEYDNSNIKSENELIIAVNVGFNNEKPEFPKYEKGINKVFPYSLSPGSRVKVLEVADDVGWRSFTRARVKIISIMRQDG